MDIQGMVAISYDEESKAVYVIWGCTSPENNIWEYGKKRFAGVGGHLFAIASDLSIKHGYEGYVVAEAVDLDLYNYYINEFGAFPLPQITNNPYRFMLSDSVSKQLREKYNYEWTDEII